MQLSSRRLARLESSSFLSRFPFRTPIYRVQPTLIPALPTSSFAPNGAKGASHEQVFSSHRIVLLFSRCRLFLSVSFFDIQFDDRLEGQQCQYHVRHVL